MQQMRDTDSMSQGSFVAGLLWGAAVGAALGVVFAPRSGAETRQAIADSGQRLRDTAQRTYDRASESVNSAVEQGRDALERGREVYEQTRTELASAVNDSRTRPV